jgi:hypothetical protein
MSKEGLSARSFFFPYDGAGFGWSEVGGADRGPKQVAAELAFLLTVLLMCC